MKPSMVLGRDKQGQIQPLYVGLDAGTAKETYTHALLGGVPDIEYVWLFIRPTFDKRHEVVQPATAAPAAPELGEQTPSLIVVETVEDAKALSDDRIAPLLEAAEPVPVEAPEPIVPDVPVAVEPAAPAEPAAEPAPKPVPQPTKAELAKVKKAAAKKAAAAR